MSESEMQFGFGWEHGSQVICPLCWDEAGDELDEIAHNVVQGTECGRCAEQGLRTYLVGDWTGDPMWITQAVDAKAKA